MNTSLMIGILGAVMLIIGLLWKDKKGINHPTQSTKNWLLGVGAFIMLIYSIMGYLSGTGAIFFIFLQSLVVLSSVLMMLNVPDKTASLMIIIVGIILLIWSVALFENFGLLFFIAGLVGIGLGFVLKKPMSRNIGFGLGGALIALFSYIGANWVFFWLNVFFGLISGYFVIKEIKK